MFAGRALDYDCAGVVDMCAVFVKADSRTVNLAVFVPVVFNVAGDLIPSRSDAIDADVNGSVDA